MASLFLPGLPHPARWPGELQLGPIYDGMTVGPRKELLVVVAQTQQKIDMGLSYSVGPRPMKNPRSLVNVHNTYGKAHGMLLHLCRLCERVRSPVVTRVSVALINLEN